MAFVLAPQQPIPDWLADLDASIECSKGIYSHHPVALDMSAVNLNPGEIAHLIENLSERGIRVLGIEGVTPDGAEGTLPPILRAGRVEQPFQLPNQTVVVNSVAEKQQKLASRLVEGLIDPEGLGCQVSTGNARTFGQQGLAKRYQLANRSRAAGGSNGSRPKPQNSC